MLYAISIYDLRGGTLQRPHAKCDCIKLITRYDEILYALNPYPPTSRHTRISLYSRGDGAAV